MGIHLHTLSLRHGSRAAAKVEVTREDAVRSRDSCGGASMESYDSDSAVAATSLPPPKGAGHRSGCASNRSDPLDYSTSAKQPRGSNPGSAPESDQGCS